jgi:hypothetical protein
MTFDDAIFIWPQPSSMGQTLRIYDLRHDLGKAAMAVACADEVTDAPLTLISATIAREVAGQDLRSDEVPWLEGFGMFVARARTRTRT